MKTRTTKLICTLALCVLTLGALSARHHHGPSKGERNLRRAADIVSIVTNSLVGLSVLSGNTPAPAVVVAPPPPPPPRPVIVTPPPPPPRPVIVTPPPPLPRHYRPAPPPRRHAPPPPRRGRR